jgi:predicted O-methyltransferase YrrM
MLENIGTEGYLPISTPVPEVAPLLDRILSENGSPVVAEIGTGVGATTKTIVERLDNHGRLLIFDFQDRVDGLISDFQALGFSNIEPFGNTRLQFDSYNWHLAKLALAARETGPFLDFAFLDGAHTFGVDAPATLILKELLKPGGYFLLDDLLWTMATSPTMKTVSASLYTAEQMETAHIKMICELFIDSDPAFSRVTEGVSSRRALYRKNA